MKLITSETTAKLKTYLWLVMRYRIEQAMSGLYEGNLMADSDQRICRLVCIACGEPLETSVFDYVARGNCVTKLELRSWYECGLIYFFWVQFVIRNESNIQVGKLCVE